jgi:hypothetical protein
MNNNIYTMLRLREEEWVVALENAAIAEIEQYIFSEPEHIDNFRIIVMTEVNFSIVLKVEP